MLNVRSYDCPCCGAPVLWPHTCSMRLWFEVRRFSIAQPWKQVMDLSLFGKVRADPIGSKLIDHELAPSILGHDGLRVLHEAVANSGDRTLNSAFCNFTAWGIHT